MAQLLYQGHGSYRIVSNSGTVIYIDPFAGKGYNLMADLILVTHEHHDHNKVSIVTKKPDCTIIRTADALKNGDYGSFKIKDIEIKAVEAYNKFHNKKDCVGYLITIDNVKLYAAGDTSETEQMKNLKCLKLDWALLPIDGFFNMGPVEASKCATLIRAKHAIPIHMKPGKLFDKEKAEAFHATGRVILKPEDSIEL